MLISPPWRVLKDVERRVLERIEIEHMQHGGVENGNLIVRKEDFVGWGIDPNAVAPSLRVLDRLGLNQIEVRGAAGNAEQRRAHRFRLTYVDNRSGLQPTDEWKKIETLEEAEAIAEAARAEKNSRAVALGKRSQKIKSRSRIADGPSQEKLTDTGQEILTTVPGQEILTTIYISVHQPVSDSSDLQTNIAAPTAPDTPPDELPPSWQSPIAAGPRLSVPSGPSPSPLILVVEIPWTPPRRLLVGGKTLDRVIGARSVAIGDSVDTASLVELDRRFLSVSSPMLEA
jgi:hypothetical protein